MTRPCRSRAAASAEFAPPDPNLPRPTLYLDGNCAVKGNIMTIFLVSLLFLVLGYCLGHVDGWSSAHTTVASECHRLGSFYVGKEVFKCVLIVPTDVPLNTYKPSIAAVKDVLNNA
jgi:hypothetical protein